MGSITKRRQLVERAEREARESPAGYKLKLLLLAGLGYGALLLAVVTALGLSIGLVVGLWLFKKSLLFALLKLIWIPIGLSWVMLQSLWVRFDPPEGHVLERDEAPELWAEVERLRLAAEAPPLHAIVIDDQLNAAAAFMPRMLGLLGHRHYLVIGLPLMQQLDPEAFAAVVAHEFGHFGGRHGHFGGWIYRVRTSWYVLLASLEAQRSVATALFVRFFEAYTPYFNAYSFVLARTQEREADATAARIAGPASLARALVRLETGNDFLVHRFWPGVERLQATSPHPPSTMLADMARLLRTPHDDDGDRLSRILARTSDDEDTHPALKERLASLGVCAQPLEPCLRSAADVLLGDLAPTLEARFTAEWQARVESAWRTAHAVSVGDGARLAELDAVSARTADEAVERARLLDRSQGGHAAEVALREAVVTAPDDAWAHARLGELLVNRDDSEGCVLLRRAIELDPDRRSELLALLDTFHARTGGALGVRDGIAEEIRSSDRTRATLNVARQTLSTNDRFIPHGLDDATLDRVRDVLERLHDPRRAWLVRKDLGNATNLPHFVMIVRWRFLMPGSEQDALDEIAAGLEVLPGTFFLTVEKHRRWVVRTIRRTVGAEVYHRR